MEIRAVGRQVHEPGSRGLDRVLYARDLVGRQVVHDDEVARLQHRDQGLGDEAAEAPAVGRAVKKRGGTQPAGAQNGCDGGGFVVAMRRCEPAALAARSPAVAARQVGVCGRLVKEHQPVRVELGQEETRLLLGDRQDQAGMRLDPLQAVIAAHRLGDALALVAERSAQGLALDTLTPKRAAARWQEASCCHRSKDTLAQVHRQRRRQAQAPTAVNAPPANPSQAARDLLENPSDAGCDPGRGGLNIAYLLRVHSNEKEITRVEISLVHAEQSDRVASAKVDNGIVCSVLANMRLERSIAFCP